MILPSIETPADLKGLNEEQLAELCEEIRTFIVDTVTTTGGHLGSNLGAVELTLALHRVFDSPRDVILWDTGHQAYVHKLLTGRRYGFKTLKQAGGMSGYPNRAESEHDWIENSHASTGLSYAHGIASGFALRGIDGERKVVAVVGDGALTGGMAYEALNNLGHSRRRVVIVLNDNGRSYAPTVSQLSQSLTTLRLNPTYTAARERLRLRLRELPALGELAYSGVHSLTSALREMVAPHTFFEALGVRYAGPIDGHDIEHMEQAFTHAAEWDGPIVVHVLTQKGRGYAPAEEDDIQRLHDVKATKPVVAREHGRAARPGMAVGGSAGSDGGGIASPGSTPERRPTSRRSAPRPTPTPSPAPCWPRPRRTRASWRSPRPCPARPVCSPSRPASPTASSTSASPSSTGSPRPPAWPWPACGPSWRCTRRSGRAPSTRPTSTSGCTAARWSSCSTGPASPATTGRATTASSTWPWRCPSRA